jgi:acyl dehydratase
MCASRWLDDFEVGERFVTQGYTVTEAEIIDFALRYDPQPFHLDVEVAERSPYGGLIASGFQTLLICFRLFIQTGITIDSGIPSPGIDEVRWPAPVRPGDTLHTEVEVLEIKPSRSKPDRGVARMRYVGLNQRGEKVLTFVGNQLILRRPQ